MRGFILPEIRHLVWIDEHLVPYCAGVSKEHVSRGRVYCKEPKCSVARCFFRSETGYKKPRDRMAYDFRLLDGGY